MLNWLTGVWNALELWLIQLWFPFQFALVMIVVLPVCLLLAWLIDRAVDAVSGLFVPSGDGRHEDPGTSRDGGAG